MTTLMSYTARKSIKRIGLAVVLGLCLIVQPASPARQTARRLMPIEFRNSAEFGWLNKEVLDRRVLDDMTDPDSWAFQGTGELTFPTETGPDGMRVLRVEMDMFRDAPAPTGNGLSAVNLQRLFPREDWSDYNRISLWIRPELSGFPMLPLQIVLHNDGREAVPDPYYREGIHYVTLENGVWQRVVWEITPLARDAVTSIEIGYWVNKMLARPGDRVAFDVGRLELQRVEPDHYEGWDVAPGKIAFSHVGYDAGSSKTALASDLTADRFSLIRVDDNAQGEIALRGPVRTVDSRLGRFQVLDFSEVRTPGRYIILAGDRRTRPFRIAQDVWAGTILPALNFFFGERCGFPVPGSHGVCHLDWTATHGDSSIVMNGGWHDAGDLSQGMVNTGEATYAMFALAERLKETGQDPELLATLIDEAKWGLDWCLKVRFDGGYRIGFASNNLWTNGIVGDADDRSREALNNPNVNYIAAAAEAIAYRVLKNSDPQLAERSLRTAKDDWRHAIVGTPGPETWSTPAYAATPIELAGIGILSSLELYQATGERKYADKAIELARTIVASQQTAYVGTRFPLAGFFFTGPDRDRLFHQFHRGNDQAPIVALARLTETFPNHQDWMDWYAVVARYSEYQKTSARATAPYGVLPAYVYHDTEYLRMPETLDRYEATPESFRAQVLQGMPMGEGYYVRVFPVWFARRGNYGVLLSQAKALATAARLRRDPAAAELAHKQAAWVVGRNPFVQSTMYGVGYDWAQQYSVSSGDFVGAVPVGMQSRGVTDLPYWPSQNMYVYKEVWVHSTSRWLWLMADLIGPPMVAGRAGREYQNLGAVDAAGGRLQGRDSAHAGAAAPSPGGALDFAVEARTAANGDVVIELTASGDGAHSFELRSANLVVDEPLRTMTLPADSPGRITWQATMRATDAAWVAVVVPDGDVTRRREAFGAVPRLAEQAEHREAADDSVALAVAVPRHQR